MSWREGMAQIAAPKAGFSMDALATYLSERRIPNLMDSMESAGEYTAKVVSNILAFARNDQQFKVSTDIGALLTDTRELARNDFDMKKGYDFRNIQIHVHHDTVLSKVECHPTMIQQVILNIFKKGPGR
ncbi:MAG: HAMP domain-containing histidine kinase [Deltaproteobacteria bacterium]|nr:HAMP domain-containing histidine kinase [Deltaproteobacteria bacterium]